MAQVHDRDPMDWGSHLRYRRVSMLPPVEV